MIFETLAAMADYANNRGFDFSSDAAQAKTVLEDATNAGTKTVIEDITAGGTIQIEDETLTVASTDKVNNQNDWYNQHLVGLQQKTPRSIVEANFQNIVY
jgi:hypothetical protein